MRYIQFYIENFKGIEELTLDLKKSPMQKVYTLVGLNESGKTTILEAINYIAPKREALDAIGADDRAGEDPHSLIPISKLLNFNGDVLIRAAIELDEEDQGSISRFLNKTQKLEYQHLPEVLTVERRFRFKNSSYVPERSGWFLVYPLAVKKRTAKKWRGLYENERSAIESFLKKRLPSILYFPNFLFEFPDKIYIEQGDHDDDEDKHAFYSEVVQDILDSLDQGVGLEKHIVERMRSGSPSAENALKGLLLEMGRAVTREVFEAWSRILGHDIKGKEVVIEGGLETLVKAATPTHQVARVPYLEFKIKDSDGYFLINQRSLGFRWFFVFLLLTQYRGFRKSGNSNLLFLLDEPASNLHSTAQQQLLESFKKLAETCHIVYTTHSHHLINPNWLEGAFVVKNEGLEYEVGAYDFTQRKTSITATRYREFVARHPTQRTYFQPILDVLDWAPSRLELVPDAIFVEGKNDFYAMTYLAKCVGNSQTMKFLPAQGSGSAEPLIALYVGWGRNFVVLLDGDAEGERQKARYTRIFGDWIQSRVFTLGDLDANWRGRELEEILSRNDRVRIGKACGEQGDPGKQKLNRCIQELLASGKVVVLTRPGAATLKKLLTTVGELLEQQKQ